MAPSLKQVYRLDSIPLVKAHYTAEGYLVDRPIVTSTGIFEYIEPDGSVRRELRLPEDVFDPQSLESYRGKPIIVTHDAGLITNRNVAEEQIGTILSAGYRSGNDVRAEIIIHDTEMMKEAGLKELSLGYNLDLEETPGEWNGQPYDVIQRNIRINHLALVREARAGEHARLNIDSRDARKTTKGAKTTMSKTKKTTHGDGILTPEELKKAVEEYKARRAQRNSEQQEDADDTAVEKEVVSAEPAAPADGGEKTEAPAEPAAPAANPVEDKVEAVKANRDRRDEEGEPEDIDAAKGIIERQDEDISTLFDIIDTLLAKLDFGNADGDDCEINKDCDLNKDSDPDEMNTLSKDSDDETQEPAAPAAEENEDEDDEPAEEARMNTDSVDRMVRERVKVILIGQKLNLDGLENMRMTAAKKEIIRAVRPSVRLDGKSSAYINAAFDMACEEVNKTTVKDTAYQMRQMFSNPRRMDSVEDENSSDAARLRMIDRQNKKED